MKSFLNAVALICLLPAVLGLTVDTPTSVVQCQPVLFAWRDGTPPYYLSLVPPAQPGAPAVKQFPALQGTSYTWIADLAGGSSFSISLKDNTGNQAYSQAVNIQTSSNSSCVNNNIQEGSTSPTTSVPASSGASGTTKTVATATGTSKSSASRPVAFGAFEVAVVLSVIGSALL